MQAPLSPRPPFPIRSQPGETDCCRCAAQRLGDACGAKPPMIRVVRSRRAKSSTIWGLKRGLSSVHGRTALVLGTASCRVGGGNCAEGGAGPSPVWTVLAFPCVFSPDTASWAAPQRPSGERKVECPQRRRLGERRDGLARVGSGPPRQRPWPSRLNSGALPGAGLGPHAEAGRMAGRVPERRGPQVTAAASRRKAS